MRSRLHDGAPEPLVGSPLAAESAPLTSLAGSSTLASQSGESTRSVCGAERSRSVLLRGRERVRHVLEPHLGAAHALERANNIAQALALLDAQPDAVAFEMLRQVPGEARRELARAVRNAWFEVEVGELPA